MREMTKRQLMDSFDTSEGRVRLYRDEMEAVIGCLAAIKTLRFNAGKLKRLAKLQPRVWGKIQSGIALLSNGVYNSLDKVSYAQYKTIERNEGFVAFTHAEIFPKFAMQAANYYKLVIAARCGTCGDCLLCMNKCDWQKCQMRKLLDTVPSAPGKHEKQQYDDGLCPYAMLDKLEFTEVQ